MSAAPPDGLFVTLEGPEGAGKSSVMPGLVARLEAAGRHVLTTREPGGTPAGERIRALLLDPASGDLLPRTEALLFSAARAELVEQVLRPALEAGAVVLCDRYADSTLAYQGHGRGLPLDRLRALAALSTAGLTPDLTLLLDLPVEQGLARRRSDPAALDRLDAADRAFHERVRRGYLELAGEDEGGRWRVIDAAGPLASVLEAAWQALAERLAPRPALAGRRLDR